MSAPSVRGLVIAIALSGAGLVLASSTMPATSGGRIGVGTVGAVLVLACGLTAVRVAWVRGWAA